MNEQQTLKWNRILHQSSFAWWDWDIAANLVEFNDLKATMLGYAPSELKGKGYRGFTDLLHPEDFAKTMDAMITVLEQRASLYQIDYRILAKDGQYHWYMDRGIVLTRAPDGRPTRLRGIVIDLGRESRRCGDVEALMDILGKTKARIEKLGVSWLTLCSCCKKVKRDDLNWIEMTPELVDIVGEDISHGFCPNCLRELYPEYAEQALSRIAIGKSRSPDRSYSDH